ncbi:hypothetical protein BBO_08974 [Beauveria brongniartii RCEF 3172]|uniref:Uncharacterized protein n=1 Tax=Beauveria brongniartii RCEF 3172 TaxID=1081107 RepID=A0A166WRT8_9HYPO|nr:hypothetical protein BBO_08974 [Beauveria brongniartii RCEF 3172]
MVAAQSTILFALAGSVLSWDTSKDIVSAKQIQSRVADLQASLALTVNKANPPYQTVDIANEPACFNMVTSCSTVYFRNMNWLDTLGEVKIRAHAHLDADVETRHSGGAPMADKVTTKTSTMDTTSTTKGWKVGLKLSGTHKASGLGGDVSGEYNEQYTTSQQTTIERSVEKSCPPEHRCTIQTITYEAVMPGNCFTHPVIDCGGGYDPCNSLSKTPVASRYPTTPLKDLTYKPCDQFLDFGEKRCNPQALEKTAPCEISVPILDSAGKPYSHMITTEEKLTGGVGDAEKASRVKRHQVATREAPTPPADIVVEFIDDI